MLVKFDFAVTQAAYVKAAMDEIPSFRPDGETPAQVQARVDSATPVRLEYVTKNDAIGAARALRRTTIEALHDACVDFLAQGRSRFRKDATLMERFARLPIVDQTFQQTMTRAAANAALWATLPQVGVPAAAFTVGQGTAVLALAGFQGLMAAAGVADGAIPGADQDFQAAEGEVHEKQAELEDFTGAALELGRSQYPVGTAEREIIDAIPTEPATGGGGGGGGGGTPPAAPANFTATQAGPGDAVEGDADPDPAATMRRVYVRPVGDSGAPVLAASSATLPMVFTISPGDYELTMTSGNADGESAPSAVVVLTVG